MRVLHITPSLICPASGLAVAVSETVVGLHKAGVDVTVASLREPAGACTDIELPCLLAERSGVPGLAAWHYSRQLRPMIEAALITPPDVVHAHGLWLYPQWLAARLARQWNRPLVITLHGMLEPWRRQHHGWRKQIMWRLSDQRTIAAATVLIATSEQEASNLRELGVRPPVVVIPLGVRWPEREGGGSDGRAVERLDRPTVGLLDRQTAGPSDRQTGTPRTALFLSRIHRSKGLLLLVEAVARLRPPGWRFVIAGPDEGGHVAEVSRQIQHAGVSAWFTFRGAVHAAEKQSLYESADLFVLPSHNENFGLVVAEALAAGLPVVTTTGTPWGELPQRGCGWICEPSGASLTKVLAEAMACPDETRRQMGARGAAWVRQDFAPEENARRHVALYQEI
jgi:glycosyltransferase involved in cell wall biosynthesis